MTKGFKIGFSITALAAMFLNLLPYLRTRGAYQSDGFEVAGFPFTFRRTGGFAGVQEFHNWALLADIALGLATAILAGYLYARAGRKNSA